MDLELFVDNVSTTVSGSLKGEIYKAFKKELGYQPEDALWRRQNNPHWDGYISTVCWNKQHCRCAIKKDGVHFPTGLISKSLDFFTANGISYVIRDTRLRPEKDTPFHLADYLIATNDSGILVENGIPVRGAKLTPYSYQLSTISQSIQQQRGIIKLATGGGKTLCLAGIIAELGLTPAIFFVTSCDLLKQAVDELTQFIRLDGKLIDIGMVGAGHKKIRDITVMTIQTAVRALDGKWLKFDEEDEDDKTDIADIKPQIHDLIQRAKVVIFDECQHVRSESCQLVSQNALNAYYRFGASATPTRDAGDDILIEACFGKQICNINASWLIQNKYLVKPHIAFIKMDNMKGERLGAFPSVYKAAIVENDYRNRVISQLALNLKEQGRNVLVLIQQINHGLLLEEMIPGSVFIHGSTSKKARKEHIELMRTGNAPITIASSIFDEGVDVKPLNALILAGGGKSSTRALQRIGRIIRKYIYPDGTPKIDAFVYDFMDEQKYLLQHAKARRKIYRSESEFVIEDFEI